MLPPGQRARRDFPRFGLPGFAKPPPTLPDAPRLRIGGEVERSLELGPADLDALPRREQVSDLHCVTTWSALGLTWSGVPLAALLDWAAPRVAPRADAGWIGFLGADGYRSNLPLEHARAEDVLLADRLDGRPLPAKHGAPLRVVAPAHYGYKSVKHLTGIRFLRAPLPSPAGPFEHPVGLVASEQRGRGIPARVLRVLFRAAVPWLVRRYRRVEPLEERPR